MKLVINEHIFILQENEMEEDALRNQKTAKKSKLD